MRKQYVLKDLKNFGKPLKESEIKFRTITQERIDELELLKPPMLKDFTPLASANSALKGIDHSIDCIDESFKIGYEKDERRNPLSIPAN